MDPLAGWARAAADGDPRALEHLVRETQAEVHRLCRHLADDQAADDLAQETYVRAIRALPTFRGDAPFRLWLLSIARRTCADALRARGRRRRLTQRLLAQPADHARLGSRAAETEQLAVLAPAQREAFVLTQLLGLSYAEAAQTCRVPVGTIRSRVARARDQLLVAHLDAQAQ